MDLLENLITENQNLIYSIIKKINRNDIKEDLFQAGCLGMVEAYYNFDAERQTKFTTYAYPYIFGSIMKFIRENHTIKLNKDLVSLKTKLEKAKSLLQQEYMCEPSIKQLSEFLNIPINDLERIENYKPDGYSLENEIYENLNFYDLIPKKDIDMNDYIFLKNELESLEEPERTIMYERYFNDKTQTELSNLLGLTQVDISRREKKVLIKLKKTYN